MKENGVVRRRLSGKEADPYIGLARKILGEMKNIMRFGGIQQLSWTKNLQNGVIIVVSSIFGQDEINISVPQTISSREFLPELPSYETSIFKICGYYTTGGFPNPIVNTGWVWTPQTGLKVFGTRVLIRAMSMDGKTIVGEYRNANADSIAGFWYTAEDGIVQMNYPGVNGGIMTGVSAQAERMAGEFFIGCTSKNKGSLVSLGDLPSGVRAFTYNVSIDGNYIVGYTRNSSFDTQAYIWSEATGIKLLWEYDGDDSYARGVSLNGKVVVGSHQTFEGEISGYETFYWTEETGRVKIGVLPGCYESRGIDVSADGKIIVGYCRSYSGNNRPFKWTAETGMIELPTPANVSAIVNKISEDGTVIVGSSLTPSPSKERACYWIGDGEMQNIESPAEANATAVSVTTAKFDQNSQLIMPR